MKKLLILCIAIIGCNTDACIDESDITNTRLPEFSGAIPKNIEQSFIVLDSTLAEDVKKVVVCSDEANIKAQRTLPGLWMWIHNSFQLYNNSSDLGQFFEQQKIDKRQRSRLYGVLYYRHLNGGNIFMKELISEYRIQNNSNGRVTSISQRDQITDKEYTQIKTLSNISDSLMSLNGTLAVKDLLNDNKLSQEPQQMIDLRNLILELTRDIRMKVASQSNYSKSLGSLRKLGYSSLLQEFEKLSFGQKIIVLEKARIDILEKEHNTQQHL